MARTLSGDHSATTSVLTINTALTTLQPGDLLRVEDELVEFRGYKKSLRAGVDQTKLVVNRGAFGTTAATHANSSAVKGARPAVVTGSDEVRPAAASIAQGTVTLDGSNPTDVATGLSTILSASVSLKSSTAPGDDPSWLSCDWSTGGTLSIYAWKNTAGNDPTLVASTSSTAVVSWTAIGV